MKPITITVCIPEHYDTPQDLYDLICLFNDMEDGCVDGRDLCIIEGGN